MSVPNALTNNRERAKKGGKLRFASPSQRRVSRVGNDPFARQKDGSPWPDASATKFDHKGKASVPKMIRRNPRIKKSDLESKTRELLRSAGYVYGRTESVGYGGVKKDLFGFCDGVAIGNGEVLFVQTCAKGDVSKRIKKMATGTFKIGNGKETPCIEASAEMASVQGCRLVIIAWSQPGGAGTRWQWEMIDVRRGTLQSAVESHRGKPHK
jgi:hypothetical protein